MWYKAMLRQVHCTTRSAHARARCSHIFCAYAPHKSPEIPPTPKQHNRTTDRDKRCPNDANDDTSLQFIYNHKMKCAFVCVRACKLCVVYYIHIEQHGTPPHVLSLCSNSNSINSIISINSRIMMPSPWPSCIRDSVEMHYKRIAVSAVAACTNAKSLFTRLWGCNSGAKCFTLIDFDTSAVHSDNVRVTSIVYIV